MAPGAGRRPRFADRWRQAVGQAWPRTALPGWPAGYGRGCGAVLATCAPVCLTRQTDRQTGVHPHGPTCPSRGRRGRARLLSGLTVPFRGEDAGQPSPYRVSSSPSQETTAQGTDLQPRRAARLPGARGVAAGLPAWAGGLGLASLSPAGARRAPEPRPPSPTGGSGRRSCRRPRALPSGGLSCSPSGPRLDTGVTQWGGRGLAAAAPAGPWAPRPQWARDMPLVWGDEGGAQPDGEAGGTAPARGAWAGDRGAGCEG